MKNWRSKILFVMAVALAMGLGTQVAPADAVTLGQLIANDGTVRVDDKIFSNFSAIQTGNLSTDADNLVVTATEITPTLDQLRFTGLVDGGCSTCGAGSGDVTINYTVSTLSGAPLIHDILLNFNGVVVSQTAEVDVTETASVGGIPVGTVVVHTPSNFTDYTVVSGGTYASIDVTKDIAITWQAGGQAHFSVVNQDVSQTAVPEPASVLLLGSGVLGLGLWGWKRRGSTE